MSDTFKRNRACVNVVPRRLTEVAMEASQAVTTAVMVTAMTTTAHVLAVDDDPSVRQMIADYLPDNDLRVTTLASGRDIGEVMERETIDLVILDVRLPNEDGMQIARKL